MASATWWTWVWVSSGSWWWAGKPGMLQSMGSQKVRHNWATKLNWMAVFNLWHKIKSNNWLLQSITIYCSWGSKARILNWFVSLSSSGPHFVWTLHCDLSILDGPTWHGSYVHWFIQVPSQWQDCDPWWYPRNTRDLFKKIGDFKEIFHSRMDTIKDLTETEEIKKRQQEYTEELYK